MQGPSAEAIRRAVDADGPVVQDEIDHVFELPSKLAWPTARIEIHRANNGYWMWAVQIQLSCGSGGGYRVGPKWGRFAVTRFDALFYACRELDERARHRTDEKDKDREAVLAWTGHLVDRAAQGGLFPEEGGE